MADQRYDRSFTGILKGLVEFLRDKGYDDSDYDRGSTGGCQSDRIDKRWHLAHHGRPHRYWHKSEFRQDLATRRQKPSSNPFGVDRGLI